MVEWDMMVKLGMAWWQNWEWYGGRIGNGVVVELEMVWWQNWEWLSSIQTSCTLNIGSC